MINKRYTKGYCKEYWKIENYEEAKNSSERWQCHHRLETHFSDGTERPINARLSQKELIALDMYYHRPAEELIFMKTNEHRKLHMKENKLGKKLKGHKSWNKGKKMGPANFSEEHREKLRQRMILMNKTRRNKNGKKD